MKLTKRFLCLLLSLCMVFLAIPAFTFPIAAAEAGDSSAKTEEPITISFRLADKRGAGATGTLVATRTAKPGFMAFNVPTAEECAAVGINANDVLGWYSIDTNGVFLDAAAYSGTYVSKDLVFYPYLKSSSLSFDNDTNFPMYDDTGVTNFRGGWQFGHLTANGFVPFTVLSSTSLAQTPLGSWTHGCVWLTHRSGQGVMGLSKTKGYVTTLSWTALVDGKVDLDFNEFSFLTTQFDGKDKNGNPANEPKTVGAYVAVALNDTIIWPTALAGQKVDVSNSDFTGYSKVSCSTPAETVMTKVEIPGATYKDLAVKGGDTIRFIVGRDNIAEVMLNATATYTETTDNYGDKLIGSVPAYQPGKPLESGQKFVETGKNDPDDANAEINYPGNWEMIVYDKPADIAGGKSAPVDHYTTQNTATKAFLTAYKDYSGAANAPLLVNHEASTLNGQDYSFLFNINSKAPKTPAAVGGYRYTAEHTGYIRANFDKLAKDSGSYSLTAASFTEVRIAIFVDGVMVWPTANADATDYANWCAPYSVPATFTELAAKTDPVEGKDYYNQRDAINEQLKDLSLFVRQGSQVDFLITYASYVKNYPRTANSFLPTVSYDNVFETGFTASAALGTNLALNFSADATSGSFQPSTTNTYLKADTLKLTLSGGAENFVFDQALENGVLTATVSGIAAKQMTEAVNYALTVEAQKPNGETEKMTIADGTLSVASYMKALYDTTPAGDVRLRDLILATLQYGAAAQNYFGYKTNALATDGMSGKVSFTLPAAVDKVAQSGSGAYAFTAATLRLEDTVQLKLLLDATNGAHADWSNLYLKVNGQPVNATIALRDGNEDGTLLQAILDVPFTELATDYTITLHAADGTQVSSTLIYSVETYAARTANVSNQADLLYAIRVAGRAACNLDAPTPEGNVVTRIGILSDAHLGKGYSYDEAKTENALAWINSYFNGETDAVIFLGDNTDYGQDADYEKLLTIVRDSDLYKQGTPFRFITGNHEFYRDANGDGVKDAAADVIEAFKGHFSEFQDDIDHTLIVNGIYFIGLSTRTRDVANGRGYEEAEAYLRQQVAAAAAANPEAPIILYSHIGHGDIAEPHPQINLSKDTVNFLKNYPQIIWFSGHTHEMLQDPHVIGQKYYTSIQAPTAGALLSDVNIVSSGVYSKDHSQGMMMTISDTNVVKIYRYDFAAGKVIGQPWTIDIPAIQHSTSNFTYSLAARQEIAAAPSFDDAATFETVELTSSYAAFKLPFAHILDSVSNDVVSFYHVSVLDKNGTEIMKSSIYSNFFRGSRVEDYIPFSAAGLSPNTTYTLQIVAESVFEKRSAPLTMSFTTPAAGEATLDGLTKLLSVDYTTGSEADSLGHALSTKGSPVLTAGQAASFNGSSAYSYTLSEDEWKAMQNSLTIETVLSIDSSNTAEICGLISNLNTGGFGLSYIPETQTLRFTLVNYYDGKFCDEPNEVYLEVAVELDTPLHIVATATGNVMCIYINGKAVGSLCFKENILLSTTDRICVGADSTSTSVHNYAVCEVENVTLYAESVTPEQVALMYQNSSVAE